MENHRYWLALSHLPDIGSVTARRWLAHFASIDILFSASLDDLHAAGVTIKQQHLLKNIDWHPIDNELFWLNKNNIQLIALEDAAYPALLREIYDPPLVLYVRGNTKILALPQIAIVGSRHPTQTGKALAGQFAKELASAGLVVTSGLARGIDGASHSGALTANGKTIAVLGTGLKHIYPKTHQKLAEDIVKQEGALVSEFPLNTPPKAANFPIRNRVISGLSLGVLVIEAAIRSGSLITARLALEQNRDVFAIPGSTHNPLARGCHQLIRLGAKLVETSDEVLEDIHPTIKPTKASIPLSSRQEPIDLDPTLQRVLTHIGYEITALDVIILRSGLTAAEVSSMLLSLELESYVRVVPGGYVRV